MTDNNFLRNFGLIITTIYILFTCPRATSEKVQKKKDMPHIHNSYPANISMQEVALLTLQLRYRSHRIKEPVDFWMIPRILLRVVYISYMSNQITIISNEISANKQEPMWTYDKLQRADLTYYIARGIRKAINTQYEIDSLVAHI